MRIGEKFTYLSNGKKRNALFLEQVDDIITAVLCDDKLTEGIQVEINYKQITDDNQLTLL